MLSWDHSEILLSVTNDSLKIDLVNHIDPNNNNQSTNSHSYPHGNSPLRHPSQTETRPSRSEFNERRYQLFFEFSIANRQVGEE